MTQRPVIVAVDGSASALRAVDWAEREAARLNAPLRLVHVHDVCKVPHRRGLATTGPETVLAAAAERGRAHLREAAASLDTGRPVERVMRTGFILDELIEESRQARLVVLGSRGLGGFTGLLLGSTAVGMAARGHCPVVVARGSVPVDSPRPVVVGVDGSQDGQAAIGFAFEHAAAHGRELVAVLSWWERTDDWAMLTDLIGTTRNETEEAATRELSVAMAGWTQRYPDVKTRSIVAPKPPAGLLLAEAEQAALVVVGSRGRGHLSGLVLGSTSHALIHHATCPVAVVRADLA